MPNNTPLDDLLTQAQELIYKDSNGDAWIKIEDLRQAMTEQHREALPPIRSFTQAKAMAHLDEELVKSFPEPEPALGPAAISSSRREGVKP